jgi:uncharacterized OsmC-like protein
VKITLTSDVSLRLEPTPGPLTIEARTVEEEYSAFHMLASSLAYCTFSVMSSWAAQTKQTVDDLVLDVAWAFSTNEPRRVSDLTLTFRWPSLPEKKRAAAGRVAELCTIHATLSQPPMIAIAAAP